MHKIQGKCLEGMFVNQAIEETRDSLILIFEKLENIECQLKRQEEDIKTYMLHSPAGLDFNKPLVAGLKSIKTSFELLRDEIDELHQLTIVLLKNL